MSKQGGYSMLKFKVGDIYQHKKCPERQIKILGKGNINRYFPHIYQTRRIRVEYISTTDPQNKGVKVKLYEESIKSLYKLHQPRKPDWEV